MQLRTQKLAILCGGYDIKLFSCTINQLLHFCVVIMRHFVTDMSCIVILIVHCCTVEIVYTKVKPLISLKLCNGGLFTGEVVRVNYSRLLLCEATANVMKQGFTILGLSTVERM